MAESCFVRFLSIHKTLPRLISESPECIRSQLTGFIQHIIQSRLSEVLGHSEETFSPQQRGQILHRCLDLDGLRWGQRGAAVNDVLRAGHHSTGGYSRRRGGRRACREVHVGGGRRGCRHRHDLVHRRHRRDELALGG